jgi:DNA-binding NarL/FixJ family response regulator
MRAVRLRVLDLGDGEASMPAPRPLATSIAVAVVGDDPRLVARVREALRREAVAASVEHGGTTRLDLAALERPPDVLVLAGADVERAVAEAHSAHRRLRGLHIVLVVPSAVARHARHVLGAGIDGVVIEGALERTLGLTVRAALAGQLSIPRAMRHGFEAPSFSPRERAILRLVVSGHTNAEIASRLYLSTSTVGAHLTAVFRRLGVRSRGELVRLVLGADESVRRLLVGDGSPDEPEAGA